MSGSSSLRARPSPCSPDSEPPYPATRRAASSTNARYRERPRSGSLPAAKGKSMRTCRQPSPKCPYGTPLQPVAVEQLVELAQVRAELLRRDGGVLPAGVRRPPVGRAVGQPGAVLADAPDGRGVRGVRDHHRVDGAGVGEHAARLALDLGDVVTGQLDDQPAGAARQVRDDGGGHVAQSLHDPLVEALDRRGLVGEQPGGGVGGVGHRRGSRAPRVHARGRR